MVVEKRFHWADYLVFCVSMGISAVIGIYYAFQSRRRSSTSEYLMGGRSMGILPVAASLVVSIVSAIFVQGVPAETYMFGVYYPLGIIGQGLAMIVASTFYQPVYYSLGLTSVYKYLELRFSKQVRIVFSVITMIQLILYASVALYAPSIAISQATGLPYWACILISAALCTFYTSLGGFKTVLWTDTLQCGIMIIGMLATLIKASLDVGGLRNALYISAIGGRTALDHIIPDPLERHTVWNWIFGDFPFVMSMFASGQFAVQRFCSVKTLTKARIAMLCATPINAVLVTIATLLGCVAYAYYKGCDPYLTGRIQSRDQTLALLVMDVFQGYPGMAGVFLSSVLSAALSTLSSVQNSFAAILLEDFLKPLKLKITNKPMEERQGTIISKIIVFLVGILIMCLAILASRSGKLVMALSSAALNLGASPALAVFTMGLFVPFVNTKGALTGLCCGTLFLGWVVIGAVSVPRTLHEPLPLSTELCDVLNSTSFSNTSSLLTEHHLLLNYTDFSTQSTVSSQYASYGVSRLYRISYKWYGIIGFIPTVIAGLIVSLLTGGLKEKKHVPDDVMFSFRKHGLSCCIEDIRENEVNDVTKEEAETMLPREMLTRM